MKTNSLKLKQIIFYYHLIKIMIFKHMVSLHKKIKQNIQYLLLIIIKDPGAIFNGNHHILGTSFKMQTSATSCGCQVNKWQSKIDETPHDLWKHHMNTNCLILFSADYNADATFHGSLFAKSKIKFLSL